MELEKIRNLSDEELKQHGDARRPSSSFASAFRRASATWRGSRSCGP